MMSCLKPPAKPLRLAALATVSSVALMIPGAIAADEDYDTAKDPWFEGGQAALAERLALRPNTNRAKNVILFVADGMSIPTITATRIFDGQSKGMSGEENSLSFGEFPYAALVKTYNTNAQVPDSAGTASAMNTGVKTRIGVIGTPASVHHGSCAEALLGHPENLAEKAEKLGMSTGVISTSLIVDATPAAVYAHSPNRGWMADSRMPEEARAAGCVDIATQMVDFGLEVALGGGRAAFFPAETADPENPEDKGVREDGRDLTSEWTSKYDNSAYVWNKAGFDALDLDNTDHLLGLFERGTMNYEADRAEDVGGEPSLEELTHAAIKVLSRNDNGYYLMVEGGRVDHANHAGNAYRALTDAQAFAEAIRMTVEMVDLDETLILVTADHSHVLTIAGYPGRGNPILGLVRGPDDTGDALGDLSLAEDDKPYTTLGYGNGPGADAGRTETGERVDLTEVDTTEMNYKQQAAVPTGSETHGGDDVALFGIGPWAHLVSGVMEQNVIFHIIDHAAGLSERLEEN